MRRVSGAPILELSQSVLRWLRGTQELFDVEHPILEQVAEACVRRQVHGVLRFECGESISTPRRNVSPSGAWRRVCLVRVRGRLCTSSTSGSGLVSPRERSRVLTSPRMPAI
jgi:hypothetical protein